MRFANSLIEAKKSLNLAIPLLFSEWLYALNFFMVTWITAQLGSAALAAIAIAQSINIFLLMMISGVSAAIAILVSQDLGAKNTDGIKYSFAQGILLNLSLTLIAGLILWYVPYFLSLFGIHDPSVAALTKTALRAYLYCLLPLTFLIMFEKFLIGLQRTRLVLTMTLCSIPISIVANYAFVLGKFGFPKYGLIGFGYGLAIAYSILDILFIAFTFILPSLKIYKLFSGFKKLTSTFNYFSEIWHIGWPLGVMFSIEVGALVVFTFFMSLFGTATLAAFQITRQYLVFALVSLFALTESAAVRVGYAVGKNDYPLVKSCFYVNIILATMFMFVLSGIYVFAKTPLIAIDLNPGDFKNTSVIFYLRHFLTAIAVLVLFDGVRNVAAGGLRGLKDTKSNMYSSIIGYWLIGIPLAYLFGKVFAWGADGLWTGFIIGIIASALFLLWRFHKLYSNINLQSLLLK